LLIVEELNSGFESLMSEKQKEILIAVKENVEKIESERYNSEDPVVTISKNDSHQEVIVKLLTSERTGAPLILDKETLYPAEDLAKRNFSNGVRTLNSWQFRKSSSHFTDAANLARDLVLQQRINLYKQLHSLLKSAVLTSPDKIVKSKGKLFAEVLNSLKKYDKLSEDEQYYYQRAIDSLYGIAVLLVEGDKKTRTQQLYARCTISLGNREYLAANIWLYKIYLLNKDAFDSITNSDKILQKALKSLQLFVEVETGVKEFVEDLPTMASAFDLQTIFADHLKTIFDVEFVAETKKDFSFQQYRM